MRIIVMGCEYTGKTSLASELAKWIGESMGNLIQMHNLGFHDHFVFPYLVNSGTPNLIGEEEEKEIEFIRTMPPSILEKYQRYQIDYHFQFYGDDHHLMVDWYFADAVYAPLYYGYGERGTYFDRSAAARGYDAKVMKAAPDTVLVLLKASPEEVRRRMRENPRRWCILKDEDVDRVLARFQEEYNDSLIRRRFEVDTSNRTVIESFRDFLGQLSPHLPPDDLLRMNSHLRLKESVALHV